MQQQRPVLALVAPLDWGLGHATRCIPIVKELIKQEVSVVIAASGAQKKLLQDEFPALEFIEIPSYQIHYKKGFFLKWALFFQIPFLLKSIKRENHWLNQLLLNRKIDLLFSDNRYGLYHSDLTSVFITHQLYIQSGMNQTIDRIILEWHNKKIKNFSLCWVPDQKGENSIAGLLSSPPYTPPIPVEYIGLLSRFKFLQSTPAPDSLLILISGPEPERTDFESILVSQLPGLEMNMTLVRGLPESATSLPLISKNLTTYNHLNADKLNALINSSAYIIARGGYSTIMDLVKLKRNAILVPTPGQPEQEYLTKYLHEKKWMYRAGQKNLNLKDSLREYQACRFIQPVSEESPLEAVIQKLVLFFVIHKK
jgi:Glycosyltransferase family 28 C-terminal domain